MSPLILHNPLELLSPWMHFCGIAAAVAVRGLCIAIQCVAYVDAYKYMRLDHDHKHIA